MATFESVKMEGAIAIDKARAVFHHAVRHLRRHLSDHESSKAFFAKLQETHHALECLSKTRRDIVTNGRCVPPTDRHASEQENQGHRQVSKNDVPDNVDVFKLLNTVASQQETFMTSLKNVDEAMKKQVTAVDLSFDCIAKLERKVATFDELAANKANGSVIVSSPLSRQVAVPSDNGQTITETRTSSRSMNPIIACEPCVRQASPNLPAKSNVLPKFSGEPTPCSMQPSGHLNEGEIKLLKVLDAVEDEPHMKERMSAEHGMAAAVALTMEEMDRALTVSVQQLGVPLHECSPNGIYEEMLRNKFIPPDVLFENQKAVLDHVQERIIGARKFYSEMREYLEFEGIWN